MTQITISDGTEPKTLSFGKTKQDRDEFHAGFLIDDMATSLEGILMNAIRQDIPQDIVDEYLPKGLISTEGRWSYLEIFTNTDFEDIVWKRWQEGNIEVDEMFDNRYAENREHRGLFNLEAFNEAIEQSGGGYGWNAAQVLVFAVNHRNAPKVIVDATELLEKEHLSGDGVEEYMHQEGYLSLGDGQHTFIIHDEAGQEGIFKDIIRA